MKKLENILLWRFKDEPIDINRFKILSKPSLFDSFWISYCRDPQDTILVPVFETMDDSNKDFNSEKQKMMDFHDISGKVRMDPKADEKAHYDSKERWANMACAIYNLRIEENNLYGDIKFLITPMGKWLESNFDKSKFNLSYLKRGNRSCINVSFLKY